MEHLELVKKYAPQIYFNENEPFFPVKVGYTIFDKTAKSPSTSRIIELKENDAYAIEYAIYWDFDIQHLYELEHVWVYIDGEGKVTDCEASFHGEYLKALFKDRSNLEDDTHICVYSQPGKHAFCPIKQFFELVPGAEEATGEKAGEDGLLVTGIFKDVLETNEMIQKIVKEYLMKFRFVPSANYVKYSIPGDMFVPWELLKKEIPLMIEAKLREIGYTGITPVKENR